MAAAVIAPVLLLFIYVAVRSGPLAPVAVTVRTVEARSITPALAGIGSVQSRFTYRIGPTFPGRLARLDVQVGDTVTAGQVLGEMDAVDLDDRTRAQLAIIRRSEAALAQAAASHDFARTQALRYERLFSARAISEEGVAIRRQELAVAHAALAAAREDVARVHAEREALRAQRAHLRLVAPAHGLVTRRDVDPGSTVVAGQSVVELVDPRSLWIETRFDQIGAEGLAPGLAARIALRSRGAVIDPGRVLRVEPTADTVTEEMLAGIGFDALPEPLPPLGELAEVTVMLDPLPPAPVVPNAALRTVGGRRGVWKLVDGALRFAPVVPGRSDLEGRVQVSDGVSDGDTVVVYSEKTLEENTRIRVVEQLAGAAP